MRPASYRDKLKRMQNHVSCLQSRANQLLREQNMAQLQVDVFEGLLCVRDAWSDVVKSVLQPGWEVNELLRLAQQGADKELQELLSERSDPPEHVLERLPLLPALSLIDRSMHAAVTQLDSNLVAKQWVAYISDTMQLLVLHELEPQVAAPMLSTHMQQIMAWLLCLYFFNTDVAFELHNVNLLTRENEPPPANHWQQAFEAAEMTEQQRRQIAIANQFCVPRLRQLQLEQQQLLQQLAELHQSAGSDDGSGDDGSPEADTGPGTPSFAAGFDCISREASGGLPGALSAAAIALTAGIKVENAAAVLAPAAQLAMGLGDDTEGPFAQSSFATDAAADVGPWGTGSDGGSGSGSGSATPLAGSNRARQHLMAKANELTQQISKNCTAWRIWTSMRAQYSVAVLTPVQLGKMVTASAPYLLIGAPIYDEVNATNPNAPPPKKRGS